MLTLYPHKQFCQSNFSSESKPSCLALCRAYEADFYNLEHLMAICDDEACIQSYISNASAFFTMLASYGIRSSMYQVIPDRIASHLIDLFGQLFFSFFVNNTYC